ncbi:hypothetical protein PBRA_003179 [Plasmodiophora brassicae]|uniref:TRP C-terminal domain-containing protein n=1 Tax=Plasmodiophora brassicae TaxID=37360 RepID=A0A0G4J7Q8_PLABS|nr:hypothetical protein PBRA_003179 [Plasmodiophora brassicae]
MPLVAALLVLTLWVGTLAIVVRDNTSRVIYNASSPSFAVSSPPSFNVFGRVVTDNPDNSTDAIAVMTWPCAESDAVYIARQCQLARCRALIFVNGPVLNDLMAWRFRGLPSGLPVLLVNDVDAERALRLPFAKATVDSSHVNKVRILLDSVWYRCLTLTVVVLSVIDLVLVCHRLVTFLADRLPSLPGVILLAQALSCLVKLVYFVNASFLRMQALPYSVFRTMQTYHLQFHGISHFTLGYAMFHAQSGNDSTKRQRIARLVFIVVNVSLLGDVAISTVMAIRYPEEVQVVFTLSVGIVWQVVAVCVVLVYGRVIVKQLMKTVPHSSEERRKRRNFSIRIVLIGLLTCVRYAIACWMKMRRTEPLQYAVRVAAPGVSRFSTDLCPGPSSSGAVAVHSGHRVPAGVTPA